MVDSLSMKLEVRRNPRNLPGIKIVFWKLRA
jgi:hypothetical protein